MSDMEIAEKAARLTLKFMGTLRKLPPPPNRWLYTMGPVGAALWDADVKAWQALRDERNEKIVAKVLSKLSGPHSTEGTE